MLEQKLHIDENRQLSIEEFWHSTTRRDALLLDVRAPIEFDRGSIPGAKSICLFDNAERATIGTLWRGQGHDVALQQGYDFLNESQTKLMEKINSLDPDKQIYVYCAKGGLRSKIACNLIRTFGKTPIQLIGGYRRFREYCTESFEALNNDNVTFISLNGLAGSGKTLILDQLPNSLNLEKCAAHSGSAFGHIGMEPASTKEFEANLLDNLYDIDTNKPIFVEAEGRRIGKLSIPKPIWQKMLAAEQIEIFADLEVRTQRMIDLYIIDSPDALTELLTAEGETEARLGTVTAGEGMRYTGKLL